MFLPSGFPNVGKSSVINSLVGRKVVSVSRTPGHTKYFQTYYLTKTVKLCDCPGLVFPSYVAKQLQVEALSCFTADVTFLSCLPGVDLRNILILLFWWSSFLQSCLTSSPSGYAFLLFLDLVRHLPLGSGAGALQLRWVLVWKGLIPLCAQAQTSQFTGLWPRSAAVWRAWLDSLGRVWGSVHFSHWASNPAEKFSSKMLWNLIHCGVTLRNIFQTEGNTSSLWKRVLCFFFGLIVSRGFGVKAPFYKFWLFFFLPDCTSQASLLDVQSFFVFFVSFWNIQVFQAALWLWE